MAFGSCGLSGSRRSSSAGPAPRRRLASASAWWARRRPRLPRAGPGRPAQARRGRDSDPRLDRRAGTPRPIPRRHRPGTSSAPRSRRRSTRLKLPVVRVGGVYPSRRKQKVSPTTMQHTAEVPAPSPPEQPSQALPTHLSRTRRDPRYRTTRARRGRRCHPARPSSSMMRVETPSPGPGPSPAPGPTPPDPTPPVPSPDPGAPPQDPVPQI